MFCVDVYVVILYFDCSLIKVCCRFCYTVQLWLLRMNSSLVVKFTANKYLRINKSEIWQCISVLIAGARSQKAFEAFSSPKGMDVGQVGRSIRSSSLQWTPQIAGVIATDDFFEKPPKVRIERCWSDQNCYAAANQGWWQSTHRPHISRWIHG